MLLILSNSNLTGEKILFELQRDTNNEDSKRLMNFYLFPQSPRALPSRMILLNFFKMAVRDAVVPIFVSQTSERCWCWLCMVTGFHAYRRGAVSAIGWIYRKRWLWQWPVYRKICLKWTKNVFQRLTNSLIWYEDDFIQTICLE